VDKSKIQNKKEEKINENDYLNSNLPKYNRKKTNLVKINSREYVLKHDANMTSYTIFNSIIENQT
jgi:hypothetical protein